MQKRPDFSLAGRDSILKPEHCGLVNTQLTLNGWYPDAVAIRGIFAPPLFSDNFRLECRINGSSVPTTDYTWAPDCLTRKGTLGQLRVKTRLVPYLQRRGAIIFVTITNTKQEALPLQIQLEVTGGLLRATHWGFGRPRSAPPAEPRWEDGVFSLNAGDDQLAVQATLPLQARKPLRSGVLETESTTLSGKSNFDFCLFLSLATREENRQLLDEMKHNQSRAEKMCHDLWNARVDKLYATMPSFRSDEQSWERLYNRSLLHLLLNEWDVPEFKLHPYYSTGSVNGGCIGGYLWNYGSPYHLWSILSPKSAREHLKCYLSVALENYFAIHADDGAPFGAYYPINHEKVIQLASAYVMQTGDVAFLREKWKGRRIIDNLMEQALMWDDLAKPAVLVNYGDGNHHLELLRSLRYDGILPDLNLRRCINMVTVADLCELAKVTPPVDLRKRALALKKLIRKKLYDAENGWYRGIDCQGKAYLRFTMQMFKALGSEGWAMDQEEEKALLKHLMNPKEFLGDCGVHSLSKLDPAYDEFDIDNGGPGACPSFTPAIIERLYRSGYANEAEQLFRRLRWLATSMPYWGDSQRADIPGYCQNTPLQCDIEGATIAQAFIFGMFGIRIRKDFTIEVTPHLPKDANRIELSNLRLLDKVLNIVCTRQEGVSVKIAGKNWHCRNGKTILIPLQI